MSDFSQNGIISTLHDFGTKSLEQIEKELLGFSKERKMELILPCLYSELKGGAYGAKNFSWTASLFLDLILEKKYN